MCTDVLLVEARRFPDQAGAVRRSTPGIIQHATQRTGKDEGGGKARKGEDGQSATKIPAGNDPERVTSSAFVACLEVSSRAAVAPPISN